MAEEFSILGFKGADLLAVLGGVSLFTERVVEVIKGWAPPLNRANPPTLDPMVEARRRAYNQLASMIVAFGVGICIAFKMGGCEGMVQTAFEVFLLAVLASGGSGFWNGILGALGVLSSMVPPRPRGPSRPNADRSSEEEDSMASRESLGLDANSREERGK